MPDTEIYYLLFKWNLKYWKPQKQSVENLLELIRTMAIWRIVEEKFSVSISHLTLLLNFKIFDTIYNI